MGMVMGMGMDTGMVMDTAMDMVVVVQVAIILTTDNLVSLYLNGLENSNVS